MPLLHEMLQPKTVLAWFENADEEYVGHTSGNPYTCPLANYLEDVGYPLLYARVSDEVIIVRRWGNQRPEKYTHPWIPQFVGRVDELADDQHLDTCAIYEDDNASCDCHFDEITGVQAAAILKDVMHDLDSRRSETLGSILFELAAWPEGNGRMVGGAG